MKLLIRVFACFAIISACYSEEFLNKDVNLSVPEKIELDSLKTTYHKYLKVGTTGLYYHAGIGIRSTDLTNYRGNDFSLNAGTLWLPSFGSLQTIFFEYDRLFYQKPKSIDENSLNYFGIGLDAHVVLLDRGCLAYPIFNPKFLWGHQYEKGNFIQLSLNLLPVSVFILQGSEPALLAYSLDLTYGF